MPEVTTSPEEQPPVTTAPEPEAVETMTTEAAPEESETMPTEPTPEPDSSPAEPEKQLMSANEEHVAHDGITDWQAFDSVNYEPTIEDANYYLTDEPFGIANSFGCDWQLDKNIILCLNGHDVKCDYQIDVQNGSSLTVYDCGNSGIFRTEYGFPAINVSDGFVTFQNGIIEADRHGIMLMPEFSGVDNSTVIINGGKISAKKSAIYANNGTINVNGGALIGTEYGIEFYASYPEGTNIISLSDNPTIEGGTADIYLQNGAKITIDSLLTATDISIKMDNPGVFATGDYAAKSVGCFKSVDPTHYMVKVTADGSGLEIVERPEHKHADLTFEPWVSSNSLPDTTGNYYLTEDVTLDNYWEATGLVNLCLNGFKITVNNGDNANIFSGYNLTVYNCEGTGEIVGKAMGTISANGQSSNFILESGKISNRHSSGCAILVTFGNAKINGGEVNGYNNGINIYNNGIVSITDGTITGERNYAINAEYGTLNLSGQPVLDGDEADIYIKSYGQMNISNLTNTEPYSVMMDTPGVFATVTDEHSAEDYVDNFTSAQDGYDVVAEGKQLKLVEKHGHSGITFERWYDAAKLPEVAGNYCLTVETTLEEGWTAPEGVTNLCLNNNALKFVDNNASYITVPTGATLNIYDCQNGEIGLNSDNYNQSALTVAGGTVTIYSGNIIGLHAPAIKCEIGGTVNIEGGKVSGQNKNGVGVLLSGGTLNMTGGVLECVDNDNSGYGDALKIESGTANLLGGEIKSNKNGIEMTDDGTIIMDKFIMTSSSYGMYIKNGTVKIRDSTITSTNDRGTIYYRSGGNVTVEIYDSAITGTDDVIYALSGGSLLSIEGGTVTATDLTGTAIYAGDEGCSNVYITDCKITGCRGMMLNSPRRKNGTAIIEGCIIQADRDFGINTQFGNTEIIDCNITSDNDSGIDISYGGSVTFSGENVITVKKYGIQLSGGNISFDEPPTIVSEEADICFEGCRMTISEPLLLGEPYTVLCKDYDTGDNTDAVFAIGDGAAGSKNSFVSADPERAVHVTADGDLELVTGHVHDDNMLFKPWDSLDSLPTEPGDYYLKEDVTLTTIWQPSGEVSICLCGHTIDYSDKGGVSIAPADADSTLSIYDCNGKGEIKTNSNGVQNNYGGTLIIYGGKIYNASQTAIKTNGTTIINGGEIIGSSKGIEVQGCNLTVNGGTIQGQSTAIYFSNNVDVIIEGGTIQSLYAEAVSNNGYTAGNLTIHGGEFIAGDDAQYAVQFSSDNGNLTLSGSPQFSGNMAGIRFDGNAKIIFDGTLDTEKIIFDNRTLYNQAFTIGAGENDVEAKQFEYVGDGDYEVQQVGSELWLVPEGAHVHEDSQMIFDKQLDRPGTLQSGNYYLIANIYTEEEDLIIPEGVVVNLCLNNRNLLQTDGCVRVKGTLNIYDCGSSPSNEIDSNGVAIVIEQGGNVTLYDGHLESQYDNHEPGGGTAVTNAGVLTIVGGDIQGDITSIENTGTLNLEGGTVSGKIDTTAGTCNISGLPTVTDVIMVSSDRPLGIAEALTNDTPLKISMDDPGVFAAGDGAVASKDCFKLTDELESKGYEIAIESDALVARLKTYTIKYESDGGTGTIEPQTKTHGTDIPISDNIFTRPGYTQTGWAIVQGASEVEYAFGYNYTENADLTLYPVWEKNEIHFYKDGVEIDDLSLKVGESTEISVIITPDSAERGQIIWTAEGMTINQKIGENVTVTGDSAGKFELTASTDGDLTTKTLTVTVTRSDSTVSAENQTVTYGDEVTITAKVEKAATNGISLMANYDNKVAFKLGDNELGTADVVGDTATLTIPATRANGFAIGDNTVTLEYSGNGELEYAEGFVTITVNKKTLTATITGMTTKTYDGTTDAEGLELKLTGTVEGDTVSASAEFAFDSANAGERTISATNAKLDGEHAGYYELSTPISISGTISPLPAELVWTDDEFAYDGEMHTVTASVKNAVAGDKFEIAYTGNTATEAGDYIAKVTALGNENYTLSGATGIEHEWKITSLSLADAQVEIVGTYTYNGRVQTPEIRVTLGGKELSAGDYTVTYSGEVKNANKYTVTLTGIGNYYGSASAEFEIAPKSLTASISGTLSKVYDGTVDVNDDVKITLIGVVKDDDVTATAEISYDSADTGTRKIVAKNITLGGEDAKNYTLASKQVEILESITPAPIDLPNTEFIYGGEAKTVIQVSGIGETVTATLTAFSSDAGEYEYSEVAKEGCYTVKLSNDNYAVNKAGVLTIKPLVAVIEWQDGEFTYDGTVHEVTATVKNAVVGDKFNIIYTGNTATEAGDYTAKVTALGNANYTLSGATGIEHNWKITAASQAAPEVKIDFINETLSTDEAMEFSVDGETWQDCTAAMNVAKTGWNGSAMTVKIRYKKDVDHLEGEIQSLVIPARRAAPDISEMAVSKSQTEISIAEIPGCEYSLDGATWRDNGSFSGLDKGESYEIHVRYKATASAFASFGSSKTVVTSSTADGTTELLPGETVAAGDGSIKNLGGEIIIDDGAGNVTTVTLPDGGSVEVDEQGNVTVPDGGEVAVGDNPAVSLPDGGKVEPNGTVIADEVKIGDTDVKGEDVTVTPDGNITVPGEGTVKVGDNPEIILPTGGTVEADGTVMADEVKVGNTDVKGEDVTVTPDGIITLPGEGQVTVGDNPEITLTTGGTVEPDGTVIADEVKIGDTDVKGEDVTVAPDGNITVPGEGSVKVGDNPEIILPTGGTVEPDGTVIADEVKIGDTNVKGEDVTVTPDGNITVSGEGQVTVGDNPEIILPTGGTVEPDGTVIADEVKVGNTDIKGEDVTVTPDGKITLHEGGKVSADGEPEKIVPAGTTIENGEINAPAIAEPADGESLGDDIILKIESANERLETADRENLKDAVNAIVREVYDIELLKNGVKVQPNKSIKLTVSADVGGAKMKVFMIDDDGKFTEIDAEFDTENGKFIIVTDSLGIFILASEEGQITSEVVASDGAPEVDIGDDDKKVLEEEVFTDEDEAAIENGDNIKVVMNVEGVSEKDIPADDIAEIEAFLDDLEGCEIAEYADITLTKITEDGVTGDEIKSEAITEINNPIKLVIDIPDALHKAGRIFSVIRLHDGKAELLADTDQSDETVTILTDKFSLYVLIYRDPASQPSHVHSFTAWINVGAGGHLARCAICGKVMSLMPHTMLNGVCTVCGYVAVREPAYLPNDGDVIEIEVPTEGMIANEEVVVF